MADKSKKENNDNVVIKGPDGNLITYDKSGLVMTLSNKVLGNIRNRLRRSSEHIIDLGDIDAWNVREYRRYYKFIGNLPNTTSQREYIYLKSTHEIFAANSREVIGFFGLGGGRINETSAKKPQYFYHIVAPADGHFFTGSEDDIRSEATVDFEKGHHFNLGAHIADAYLAHCANEGRSLPISMVRYECDNSQTLAELSSGVAYDNFITNLETLIAGAKQLGLRSRVAAISIDFLFEEQMSETALFVNHYWALLKKIQQKVTQLGLNKPHFVSLFDSGGFEGGEDERILEMADMAWLPSDYNIAYASPRYAFAMDEYSRPTAEALEDMAILKAACVHALEKGEEWFCPQFLLAHAHGKRIKITARTLTKLMIDKEALFATDDACGFSLEGGDAKIINVNIDKDNSEILWLELDKDVEIGSVVRYAYGALPMNDGYAANRGIISDNWAFSKDDGSKLRRYALSAKLKVLRQDTDDLMNSVVE